MKAMRIALIGECMIELQETGPGQTRQTFGGDTLNTAIYCARLARDLPLHIDYVTALGQDSFSTRMIQFWEKEGVGSSLVQRQQGELPGLYYIELDEHGERIFHYWRSAAAARKCFEYPGSERILENLLEYDGIYLSGISLAILTKSSLATLLDCLKAAAQKGVAIYFDCNYRPHLWPSAEQAVRTYEQLYPISRIVFLTTEEAQILLAGAQGKRVHEVLHDLGARETVLKDGENPCTIHADGVFTSVSACTVARVIDTTAAGDSFSGAYLVARCFGCSPHDSATLAHKAAAYVVSHKGAVAPVEQMPVTGKDILNRAAS
jgi:2-dehydro-3-deoxygluconokinase